MYISYLQRNISQYVSVVDRRIGIDSVNGEYKKKLTEFASNPGCISAVALPGRHAHIGHFGHGCACAGDSRQPLGTSYHVAIRCTGILIYCLLVREDELKLRPTMCLHIGGYVLMLLVFVVCWDITSKKHICSYQAEYRHFAVYTHCDFVSDVPLGNDVAGIITKYPTESYYPDAELTSS